MQLFIVDATGTQNYIFASNRLRENLGASFLVAQATGPWVLRCLIETVGPDACNVDDAEAGTLNAKALFGPDADPDLRAEVFYTGGGNAVILFEHQDDAAKFERQLSEYVLCYAPGLRLATARVDTDPYREPLVKARKQLGRKLLQRKQAWPPSAPLLGLSVTQMCRSTSLPAIGTVERPDNEYPASAETLAKWHAFDAANKRLKDLNLLPPDERYVYPLDFDDLGRSEGDMSYLAVVHADGNGMGQRLLDQTEGYTNVDENRDYIKAVRDFSDAVKDAAQEAQKVMLQQLLGAIDGAYITHEVEVVRSGQREIETLNRISLGLEQKDNKYTGCFYLPFRPIVFGGDDLTFVCDGRLGIALAHAYLNAFEQATKDRKETLNGRFTASAGVAIVKAHYPFARAYDLAETLTGKAKQLRRVAREFEPKWEGNCLDWHFAIGGLSGSLDHIRQLEYTVPWGRLDLRPMTMKQALPDDLEAKIGGRDVIPKLMCWEVIQKVLNDFQESDWAGRRNKAKRLRESLRRGPSEVQRFTDAFGPLPALPGLKEEQKENLCTKGWTSSACAYFDALELADLYMPLSPVSNAQKTEEIAHG